MVQESGDLSGLIRQRRFASDTLWIAAGREHASFTSRRCCWRASSGGQRNQRLRPPEVCKQVSEKEIAGLFDRWNVALQTGDAHKVVANYASKSVLLPTVSNQPRVSAAEKEDYFEHFLQRKPVGVIDW